MLKESLCVEIYIYSRLRFRRLPAPVLRRVAFEAEAETEEVAVPSDEAPAPSAAPGAHFEALQIERDTRRAFSLSLSLSLRERERERWDSRASRAWWRFEREREREPPLLSILKQSR